VITDWTPRSWRSRPAEQQPSYPEPARLQAVLERLAALPPLVTPAAVAHLQRLLAEVAQGRRFLLQGGDCAERFEDCYAPAISDKLKVLLQMSVVLTYGLRKPIVRVGRLAGQYAKPRSTASEEIDGVSLPVYRGDLVNQFAPTPAGRVPDPERMLQAYFHAAATLNYVRALIEGGFADLHHPENWSLAFIRESERHREYAQIVARILDAISFMEACGSTLETALGRIDFFTSHEALVLPYEEALTRREEASGQYFNVGAHMLWLGDRTRGLEGAHVEYLRGIANPIGIKVGPTCTPDDLARLVARLNPENRWGRVTLITRLGVHRVRDLLPPLIHAMQAAEARVLWSCDPMHGNTIRTAGGVKTRDFDQVLSELRETYAIHGAHDSRLGGVHFELTGEDVTECLGGARRLGEADLQTNYATYCDPRLNAEQSLEMAFLLVQMEAGEAVGSAQ
jgi:3-deoxy-7-phosphoheptulonate synthase